MSTLHTRRKFLRSGILGGAMAWSIPAFLENTFLALDASAADSVLQSATGKDSPILVVLQLAGGNDGLNTVIPYADDAYYKARPTIGVAAAKTLKVDDRIAFHSSLAGMRGMYDSGELALIQGVGYPNPNRSHFRSTEIWQTASDSNKVESKGWLGRYFDSCCKGEDPAVGVSIGSQAPQAFAAEKPTGITLSKPEQFRFVTDGSSDPGATDAAFRDLSEAGDDEQSGGSIGMLAGSAPAMGDTADYLRRVTLDAQIGSDKIMEITKKVKPNVTYPNNKLASQLSLVARLIGGGMSTRVYYVSQGGFDTHSGQVGSHARLLSELDSSLKAFVADLKAQGNFGRVMVMTFSEFGRRVSENQSGGTDHGAAAPLFVIGGGVHGGVYGKQPSLTELHDGDLIYNVDFRNVYSSVLEHWLRVPSATVLKRKYPLMSFV